MKDLHALLGPIAALAQASGRDQALIGPLELAVLDTQEITLPRVSGRKSARLLAAERGALVRAEEYARHLRAREAVRPVMEGPAEYPLPCWLELPALGEVFTGACGQQLECIDVLYENPCDTEDDHTPHLLLVLPWRDHDDGEGNEMAGTLD